MTPTVARVGPRFSRYTVASLTATAITQLVLWVLYAQASVGALTASAIGFAVGAAPHFVMIRWWAWGQRGRPRLTRQVVGYLVVTALGGLVSVGFTTLADALVGPLVADLGARTLVLNLAYALGGLPVFVAKFALLDRLFAQPANDSASSTSVRAPKPVAPGTTSP